MEKNNLNNEKIENDEKLENNLKNINITNSNLQNQTTDSSISIRTTSRDSLRLSNESKKRVSFDTSQKLGEKFIFIFVGLPATGKSYISSKLAKYLNWMGFVSKVFSIGLYRRILIGCKKEWTFFIDEKTAEMREYCFTRSLDDMVTFLIGGGKVGIIDGTNTRIDRRKILEEYIKTHMPSELKYSIMYIESICTLDSLVETNIIKHKLKSPDYQGCNENVAIKDFRARIEEYKKNYKHLSPENDGENVTYIQLKNLNSEIQIRNVKGFLKSKTLSFLINLITNDKPIYFTRHGGSENNEKDLIGGDTSLNEDGVKYSEDLFKYLSQLDDFKNRNVCTIYCSTLKRSIETANKLSALGTVKGYRCLDDLNVGVCDGLSYQEIKERFPKDYDERIKDKLNYRYPRGESYRDLITRIEPFIHAIERRTGPVIVIGHQSTLRCLYGYLTHTPLVNIPYIDVPVHTLVRKIPQAYGYSESRIHFDVEKRCHNSYEPESKCNYEDNVYNVPN